MSAAIAAAVAGPALGALIGSGASQSAADTQASAAKDATAAQLSMFDTTQANIAPWMRTGQTALSSLAAFMGLPSQAGPTLTYDQLYQKLLPQFTKQATAPSASSGHWQTVGKGGDEGQWQEWVPDAPGPGMGQNALAGGGASTVDTAGLNAAVQAALAQQSASAAADKNNPLFGLGTKPFTYDESQDPMAQFMLKTGSDAITNQRSALGGVNSGTTLKALSDYGQNTALSSYQNEFNNYNTYLNSIFDRLSGISKTGESAATGIGTLGANVASQVGNNTMAAGASQAAGTMGSANAMSNGLQSMSLPVANSRTSVRPIRPGPPTR